MTTSFEIRNTAEKILIETVRELEKTMTCTCNESSKLCIDTYHQDKCQITIKAFTILNHKYLIRNN